MRTEANNGDENDEEDMENDDGQSEDEKKAAGEDHEMVNEEDKKNERDERRKYRAYKFSGKNYSFDINHERSILDNLRTWSWNYFSNEYVITKSMYRLLKDLKGN